MSDTIEHDPQPANLKPVEDRGYEEREGRVYRQTSQQQSVQWFRDGIDDRSQY
jgi:hypothetical protein